MGESYASGYGSITSTSSVKYSLDYKTGKWSEITQDPSLIKFDGKPTIDDLLNHLK